VTDVAISIDAISKRFRREKLAVDSVTFAVERGQVCGLLGPNGAGKTTTLRMLLGLVHPDAGSSAVLGARVRPGHPVLSRVGTLVERPAFIPHLSGRMNLKLWWRAAGASWPPPALDEALDIAGLGDDLDRKVKTYSQGMRQRLGIAQALMSHPEVIVLDEPTNGLDPGETKEFREMLRRIAGSDRAVLVSSHLLAEIEQSCTHVVVMDRGRMVSAGSVRDLIGGVQSVYIEVDDRAAARRALGTLAGIGSVRDEGDGLLVSLGDATRPNMVAVLVHAGAGVQVVTSRNRLEDAFLGLIGKQR